MKVTANFYNTQTQKYYQAIAKNCDCVDDGIMKIKTYLSRKHELHTTQMINTDYRVIV